MSQLADSGAFTLEVITYLAREDLADSVFFVEDDSKVKIVANCNDLFWWATADGEEITPGNFAVLKQSIEDCRAVDKFLGIYGFELFACRVRKMRPQDAAYPDEKRLWPLFDAAGPEREVKHKEPFGNPMERERYWQRRQERKKSRLEELEAELRRLEAENKRLELIEQGAGSLCPVCAWNGVRGDDPCAYCEVERLKASALTPEEVELMRDLVAREVELIRASRTYVGTVESFYTQEDLAVAEALFKKLEGQA